MLGISFVTFSYYYEMIFHTNIQREIWSDVILNGRNKINLLKNFTSRHNKKIFNKLLTLNFIDFPVWHICSDKTILHIGIYVSEYLFHIHFEYPLNNFIEFLHFYSIMLMVCCRIYLILLHKISLILNLIFLLF